MLKHQKLGVALATAALFSVSLAVEAQPPRPGTEAQAPRPEPGSQAPEPEPGTQEPQTPSREQPPPHQHRHEQPPPSGSMSARCSEMMAAHQKAMTEMKASDARLDELVANMHSARGEARVDAMAAVVTELVARGKEMHGRMMSMHAGMTGHIMEHMQAGDTNCPMMKKMDPAGQ